MMLEALNQLLTKTFHPRKFSFDGIQYPDAARARAAAESHYAAAEASTCRLEPQISSHLLIVLPDKAYVRSDFVRITGNPKALDAEQLEFVTDSAARDMLCTANCIKASSAFEGVSIVYKPKEGGADGLDAANEKADVVLYIVPGLGWRMGKDLLGPSVPIGIRQGLKGIDFRNAIVRAVRDTAQLLKA